MTVRHACVLEITLRKIQLWASPGAKGECGVLRKLLLTFIILTALAASAPAGIAAPYGAKRRTSTTDDNEIYAAVLRYAYQSKVFGQDKRPEPPAMRLSCSRTAR